MATSGGPTPQNYYSAQSVEGVFQRLLIVPAQGIILGLILGALFRVWVEQYWELDSVALDYFFNLDSEYRFAAWASSMLLFCGAVVFFVISGVPQVESRLRARCRFFGLLLVLLSLDELTAVHEGLIGYLRSDVMTNGLFYFPWVFAGIAFSAAVALSSIGFLLVLCPRTRRCFLLSGAVFCAGAIGVEMQGALWAFRHGTGNLTYQLVTIVEESLELAGVLLLFQSQRLFCLDLVARAIPIEASVRPFTAVTGVLWDGLLVVAAFVGIQALVFLGVHAVPTMLPMQVTEGYVEFESLPVVKRIGTFGSWVQETKDSQVFFGQWHEDDHSLIQFRERGQQLEVVLEVAESGVYEISGYLTKGWDYGVVRFSIDGQALGPDIDLYNKVGAVNFGPVYLGRRELRTGKHRLGIQAVGSNPESQDPHYNVGIDGLSFMQKHATGQ